jgi:hypothetical protein
MKKLILSLSVLALVACGGGVTGETGVNADGHTVSLNRPDLWQPSTEYDFGQGLYGQRWIGTITATGNDNVATSLARIAGVTGLYTIGGWYQHWDGTKATIPSVFDNYAPYRASVYISYANEIALRTNNPYDRTNAPYDVWITYTK